MGLCIESAYAQAPGEFPEPMIEISAKVFEFRYDTETQFGIFYQFNETDPDSPIADTNIFLPGTANPSTDEPIRALDLTGSFASIDYGDIDFNVKSALQEGWGTVISNPTLVTTNGQQASIHSGEEIPYTEVEISGNKVRLRLQKRSTGVKLTCTPYILPRDRILLDLQLSNNDIVRFEVFERNEGQRYELPVISTRRVRTAVILPSGQRLYIGGLWSRDTRDITRKLPIIGDLPGIGFFFRGFNKAVNKSETMFQIIPTIRSPGTGLESQLSAFENLLNPESGRYFDDDTDGQDEPFPEGPVGVEPPAALLEEAEAGQQNATSEVDAATDQRIEIQRSQEDRPESPLRRSGKAHRFRD